MLTQKPHFIILCLIFSAVRLVSAQWYFGPNLNQARHGLDVVDYQGNIYAIGGWNGDQILEVLENDVWSFLTSLPEPQSGLAAAIVGNKIYTFGSYGWLDVTQIYDIDSDSWSAGPDIPQGLYWATAEATDSTCYLIGGYSYGGLNTLYLLNTNTNMWSQGAEMPGAIQVPASALYDDHIYVFGNGSYYKYDIAGDSWISFPAPPSGHGYAAEAVTVDDKIYLFGGNAGYIYEAYTTVEVFNPATGIWEADSELNVGRYQFGATYVNGKIYAIGGRDENAQSIGTVEILDIGVGVNEDSYSEILNACIICDIHPNPFRSETKIRYGIGDMGYEGQNVTLQIYDATGRLVKSFSRQLSAIGYQLSVKWDGRDDSNRRLPSGAYFVKSTIGDYTDIRQLLLIR